jgi:uncharacterized alpha-E superfamily protein
VLSRVADALYWMGRYVERAEHAARVLLVSRDIELDLGQLDADAARAHLGTVLSALGISVTQDEIEPAVHSPLDAASIASCIERARQNARQVREATSSPMWEQLNVLYWRAREAGSSGKEADLFQVLGAVVDGCLLWTGVTDSTMSRDEGWLFIKLGQHVERADRISRLIMARAKHSAAVLAGKSPGEKDNTDNLLWLSVLRSSGAVEAYRAQHPTRISARRVLEFMVLEQSFPRAVRFSVDGAAAMAREIAAATKRGADVERRFGRLAAQLDYADMEEVASRGADHYLSELLLGLGDASLSVQKNFFLH